MRGTNTCPPRFEENLREQGISPTGEDLETDEEYLEWEDMGYSGVTEQRPLPVHSAISPGLCRLEWSRRERRGRGALNTDIGAELRSGVL